MGTKFTPFLRVVVANLQTHYVFAGISKLVEFSSPFVERFLTSKQLMRMELMLAVASF